MNLRDREMIAATIASVAAQAKRELFAPLKVKGNYAERLRQHFAAKARSRHSENSNG